MRRLKLLNKNLKKIVVLGPLDSLEFVRLHSFSCRKPTSVMTLKMCFEIPTLAVCDAGCEINIIILT